MTCYHFTTRGKYKYLCESDSTWDKILKKVTNKKSIIGTYLFQPDRIQFRKDFINQFTGQSIKIGDLIVDIDKDYLQNNHYCINLNNNQDQGTVTNVLDVITPIKSILDDQIEEILDSYKTYGLIYVFETILKKTKLIDVMKFAMPDIYDKIINIAYYIIAQHKPMMYCEDWMETVDIETDFSYSSQNISKIFNSITPSQRDKFYYKWLQVSREDEFLAVDITSISTYSKNIANSESGHNREGLRLKQINLCTLFGEKSYLPMYQTEFSGSLNDVSTLETIISEFNALIGDYNFTLVMDKGFYSVKNIEFMLSKKDIKFVTSVPLTSRYTTLAIDKFIESPKVCSNYIINSTKKDKVYTKPIQLNIKDHTIFLLDDSDQLNTPNLVKLSGYIYYNPVNNTEERDKFFTKLHKIKIFIEKNGRIGKYKAIADKYLHLTYSKNNKKVEKVEFNDEAIEEKLKYAGYFILISNSKYSDEDMFNFYRKRNVVEETFKNYKSHLGLDRYRVHGDNIMVNKSFVYFISLIIYSYIFKIMLDKSLFTSRMTLEKLLIEFTKVKSYRHKGKKVLRPLTCKQKNLFSAFNFDLPKT